MAVQTVKLLGKQFVLIPKREYDQMREKLARQERQDRGDVAEMKRRSKEPSIPLDQVRRNLGF